MRRRRGEDKPEPPPSPEKAVSPDGPSGLLTSQDIFGDMLDEPPSGPTAPARKGPSERPATPRKAPIKVQVSEPGAARKQAAAPSPLAGAALPEDVAALLDAFSAPAEAAAQAEAASAEPSAPASAALAAEPASADEGQDDLLHEVLSDMGAAPAPVSEGVTPEDLVDAAAEAADAAVVIEPPLEMEVAVPTEPWAARRGGGAGASTREARAAEEEAPLQAEPVVEDEPASPRAEAGPPDPGHAEGLRDLRELRPPERSILHPLDALGEVGSGRPSSRRRTKFKAAEPKATGDYGPRVDLAAVAADALVQPEALVPPLPPPVEAPPPSPRVPVGGTAYGPYRLLERVAMGGMAEVFKAKRTGVEGFEKVLAVKRILPHLSDNKEFVDMFIDEAKMVAGLAHPNIVQIFDLGKIEKSYYIAMEYVHGRDLRSILRRAREREMRPPLDLSLLIVSRVSSALEFAHRKKDERGRPMMIVHRDVSPQNILISFEGDVKLTDFGIAKAASKASITDAGALRGKLLYMSPEQAWGKVMDRRSDIFSLGIVFYEMVTDHRPFLGNSETSILEMVRECQVAPPSTLNPRVPEKLEQVIMKALARDPEDRYQDAAALCRDLERVLHEWQPPPAGALARFLEVLFDEDERSDAVKEPPAEAAGPAAPEGAPAVDEEFEITPPPSPPEPPREPPPAKDSMSIYKLLKRFGIK